MGIKWHKYSWLKNGKGLKLNTLTAGYVFVEEDGGMGKVLEILNLGQALFIINSNKLYERMLKLIREQEKMLVADHGKCKSFEENNKTSRGN